MNETNSPAPPPPPAQKACANCGSMQMVTAPYCTHCGAPLQVAANSNSTTTKVIIAVALGFGALSFGAVGACFALVGGTESFTSAFGLFVLLPGLAALACLWGIFHVLRR